MDMLLSLRRRSKAQSKSPLSSHTASPNKRREGSEPSCSLSSELSIPSETARATSEKLAEECFDCRSHSVDLDELNASLAGEGYKPPARPRVDRIDIPRLSSTSRSPRTRVDVASTCLQNLLSPTCANNSLPYTAARLSRTMANRPPFTVPPPSLWGP